MELSINGQNYLALDIIGRGKLGTVRLARNIDTNTKVAIKTIIAAQSNNIERDINIPKMLSHKNIIKISDYLIGDNIAYIIYPYFENTTTIQKLLTKNQLDHNQFTHMINLTIQICDAIEFMHNAQIVHRDIKPCNIIVYDQTAVLIDFDMAAIIDSTEYPVKDRIIGSPYFIDPAIWRKDNNLCYKLADIYSFGVTLYHIFGKKLYPYKVNTIEELECAIRYSAPKSVCTGYNQLNKLIMTIINKHQTNRLPIDKIRDSLINISSTMVNINPNCV